MIILESGKESYISENKLDISANISIYRGSLTAVGIYTITKWIGCLVSVSILIQVIYWEGYGYWVTIGSTVEFHNIADLPKLDSDSYEEQNLILGYSCKMIDMRESGPLISDRHRISRKLEKIY